MIKMGFNEWLCVAVVISYFAVAWFWLFTGAGLLALWHFIMWAIVQTVIVKRILPDYRETKE